MLAELYGGRDCTISDRIVGLSAPINWVAGLAGAMREAQRLHLCSVEVMCGSWLKRKNSFVS
jgi:hypothetical protein